MFAALEQSLRAVPFLASFGIRVEEVRPGALVLKLPYSAEITSHGGALHNAAIFALGEVAAAVVVSTHPDLAPFQLLHKSSRVKYYSAPRRDVTAHATIPPEVIAAARAGESAVEIVVRVLDGHAGDVAELWCRFGLRSR